MAELNISAAEAAADNRGMIMEIGLVRRDIAMVDGKVDVAVALLREMADRQGRAETRVDRLESEFDQYKRDIAAELRARDDRHSALGYKVAAAFGGFSVLAIIIPIALRALGV